MKKILLTGRDGQVGWELQKALAPLGKIFAYDRNGLDLQNADQIRSVIRDVRPHVIVNAAAYTAVDKAETDTETAHEVNAKAPGIMAEEAKALNALLVHYSTDYVFDGMAIAPYSENAPTSPWNVYGKTKLDGERAIQSLNPLHLILRTSWVYGMRGKNFLLTMLRLGKEKDLLRIVGDQLGAPTWSRLIAETTASMLNKQEIDFGVYHLTSAGQTSWCGFAEAIFKHYGGKIPQLQEITTADYPTPAQRPKYSVLSNAKLLKNFQLALPDWEEALKMCLAQH